MLICDRLTKALATLSEKLKFEELVHIDNPQAVFAEVRKIVLLMFPNFDFALIQNVYNDILKLFSGHYPGYRKCNTLYHDLNHTTDCLLAMARLMHGAFVNGIAFSKREVELGLISALMHDTGYIQSVEDVTGTGAKYTLNHISRSNEFMKKYFIDHGYPWEDFHACRNFLKCTGLEVKIDKIKFESREHETIGKILGTADLIGQMSDKNYLKRLSFLYREYEEGGVTGFADEFELFKKTPHFWELVKKRFATEFSGVDAFLADHFRVRWGIDQDLYRRAIDRNMECLQSLLESPEAGHRVFPQPQDVMGPLLI